MKEIKLSRGFIAILDDEDFEKIGHHKWYAAGQPTRPYATRWIPGGNGAALMLHREIMNAPKGIFVDHINGNSLDNRRSNLRLCTHQENMMNCRPQRQTKSGYKGVHFIKANGRRPWLAYIGVKGKRRTIGHFANKEDAALAYNQAAIEEFGEFAGLNVLKDSAQFE